MDVAGAIGSTSRQNPIHDRDRRRLGAVVLQIGLHSRHVDDDRGALVVGVVVERVAVERGQSVLDLGFQRDHRLHVTACGEAQVIERLQIARVGGGDHQRRADLDERHRRVLARNLFGQIRQRLGCDGVRIDPRRRHTKLSTEAVEHLIRAGESELHQNLAEPLFRTLLARHRLAELFLRQRLALDEDLAECGTLSRCTCRPVRSRHHVQRRCRVVGRRSCRSSRCANGVGKGTIFDHGPMKRASGGPPIDSRIGGKWKRLDARLSRACLVLNQI